MGFSFDAGGLSRHQAAALAAVMACKPCCGGDGVGSGSGSGSDGELQIIPCCENDWVPSELSWEVTGIACGDEECLSNTSTGLGNPDCAIFIESPPDGWQLREGGSLGGGGLLCEPGGIRTVVGFSLCCLELIADPTQTQIWVTFSISFAEDPFTGNLRSYGLTTNLWDVGLCDPGLFEIINRPLELTASTGTLPCTFTDPRVTLIIT
jgi:hypothetical protein